MRYPAAWHPASKIVLLSTLLLAFLLLSFGCGGDDGGTDVEDPVDTDLSGVVMKGAVEGAEVRIHAFAADGTPGELLDGPVLTDADGEWTAVLPGAADDDFLVVATGGSYVDEANPDDPPVQVGTRTLVGYGQRSQPGSVVVSPFTQVLADVALDFRSEGMNAVAAWDQVAAAMQVALGFDVTTTTPAMGAGATPSQKLYAALLGGFSLLVDDHLLLSMMEAHPMDKILALAEDLGDGAWDGRDRDGNAITVPLTAGGTIPLPGLDSSGFDPLLGSSSYYAENEDDLQDVDIPPDAIIDFGVPDVEYSCEELPDVAYAALEGEMFALLNGSDPERPEDIELDDARFLYEQLRACDGTNLDARLALAMLDLVQLATDEDVNAAFDEWDAYLEDFLPFETVSPQPKLSVEPGLPTRDTAFQLPLAAVQRMLMAPLMAPKLKAVPQLSSIQDIFTDVVLPVLETSIEHLDAVLQDPDFTFAISGKLQGDTWEDEKVADATDFLALRAALHGLTAGLNIAAAYEMSLPDYSGAAMLAAMDPVNGNYLTLRAGGAARMQSVTASLLAAASDIDAGITSLLNEDDDQKDDILKIGPDDISQADIESFQDVELPMIVASLQGPVTHVYDWDFDDSTPDVALRIDLSAFFANPVSDWKDEAPGYVLTMVTVPFEPDWNWSSAYEQVEVEAPSAGWAWADLAVSYDDFIPSVLESGGDPWLIDALMPLFQQYTAALEATVDWDGDGGVYLSVGATMSPGSQLVNVYIDQHWETAEEWVEIPVITFDADSYEDWLADFPDPTLQGLFPDATSAADILPLFGMEEWDWEKVIELDWADGYDEPDFPIGPGF